MRRNVEKRDLASLVATPLVGVALWLFAAGSAWGEVSLAYVGHGGQGTVSGSLHALHADDALYLIDVGLFMGGEGPNYPWPDELPVGSVKAVFITHAHADHIGRLPLLLHEGYRGPLYMTEVTRDIACLTLPGNIHRSDLGVERFYYSRHNEGRSRIPVYLEGHDFGDRSVAPHNRVYIESRRPDLERRGYYLNRKQRALLEEDLLERLERQVRILHPGERKEIDALVEASFIHTSHLPGSVMVALSVAGRDLLFSGDVGSGASPLLAETPLLERRIDYLWLEGTYAAVRRTDYPRQREEFRRRLGKLVGEGYRVVIPAFVIDRTQQVLLEIQRAMEDGLLPQDTPVKVYSRSANEITRLYRSHAADPRIVDHYYAPAMHGRSFSTPGYSEPRIDWNAEDPLRLAHGEIGIMTSGMAEYAFARRAVEDYGGDRRTAFYFVSYQSPRTPGGRMTRGARRVTFDDGTSVRIRARVDQSAAFSGHADPGHMVEIFGGSMIGQLFLVHVDEDAISTLSSHYGETLGVPVRAPCPGERIELPSLVLPR